MESFSLEQNIDETYYIDKKASTLTPPLYQSNPSAIKIQFYFQFLDSCDIDRSASFYISIHHVSLFELLNDNEVSLLRLDSFYTSIYLIHLISIDLIRFISIDCISETSVQIIVRK
ncbi:unnamed protein product [Rotaria sp. Silwood1]|nr:unnamed protein product [Rotaria sp. Silwood1]